MSPPLPLVSLIITTKNRARFVVEAIESAIAIPADGFTKEIIVVDDGSTDDTPEALRRYDVRVVTTTGLGMPGARNAGLAAATGDFVSILDDDDVWLPAAVNAQLAMFAEHPEYAAVHGQAQLTDMDLVPFNDPAPPGPLSSGWVFEEMLAYFTQIGTVVTRMSAAREAGWLDTTLPAMCEWDWFLRTAKRHPIGRLEVPVMLFRQRGEPEEELMRKRFPGSITVFRRHVDQLPLRDRIRLRPHLWQLRGWCASIYLNAREIHQQRNESTRARNCLRYAFAVSPPHTAVELVRRGLRKRRARG